MTESFLPVWVVFAWRFTSDIWPGYKTARDYRDLQCSSAKEEKKKRREIDATKTEKYTCGHINESEPSPNSKDYPKNYPILITTDLITVQTTVCWNSTFPVMQEAFVKNYMRHSVVMQPGVSLSSGTRSIKGRLWFRFPVQLV